MTAFADIRADAAPRPWLSFFDFLFRDREAQLRATLHGHGVTIIPTRLVEEHVAKMERLSRPTFWHSVMYMIAYVTSMLSLRLPLHFLLRENTFTIGVFALGLAIGGAIATYFGASPLFALPAAVWGFEISILVFLVLTEDKFRGKALEGLFGAISRWQLYRPRAIGVDQMPAHISSRLSKLASIPGVRPFILADTTDPFLVAVSGYGPFAARCYVGAWRTGNPKLDDFR